MTAYSLFPSTSLSSRNGAGKSTMNGLVQPQLKRSIHPREEESGLPYRKSWAVTVRLKSLCTSRNFTEKSNPHELGGTNTFLPLPETPAWGRSWRPSSEEKVTFGARRTVPMWSQNQISQKGSSEPLPLRPIYCLQRERQVPWQTTGKAEVLSPSFLQCI